jgi:hypothetical protein
VAGAFLGYAYGVNTGSADIARVYAIVGGLIGLFALDLFRLTVWLVKMIVLAALVIGGIAILINAGNTKTDSGASDAAQRGGTISPLAATAPAEGTQAEARADALSSKTSPAAPLAATDSASPSDVAGNVTPSLGGTNPVGTLRYGDLELENQCSKEVAFWFTDPLAAEDVASGSWWRLAPGRRITAADATGANVRVTPKMYFYARTTDDSIVWQANANDDAVVRTIENRAVRFRLANMTLGSNGNWLLVLTCN